MKLQRYQDFIILEKFDDNIKAELNRLGVTDEKEIEQHLYHAHRGHLADYLRKTGNKFTFGMFIVTLMLCCQNGREEVVQLLMLF